MERDNAADGKGVETPKDSARGGEEDGEKKMAARGSKSADGKEQHSDDEENDSSSERDDKDDAVDVKNNRMNDDDDGSTSGSDHEDQSDNDGNESDKDGEDDKDGEESDNDSSNNDDESKAQNDPEDRELSEYELLRLERIKRNREYLSALGLEDVRRTPVRRRRRKKSELPQPTGKKRSSGRVTKSVNYAAPRQRRVRGSGRAEKPTNEKKETTPKRENHIMERFIYREFARVRGQKNHNLKRAEKTVRVAKKEVAYWKKHGRVWERQEERRLEKERIRKLQEEERASFGGGTLKELLQDIDQRMPVLISAASQYDEIFEVCTNAMDLGFLCFLVAGDFS
jgi:hypothetical protein